MGWSSSENLSCTWPDCILETPGVVLPQPQTSIPESVYGAVGLHGASLLDGSILGSIHGLSA